MSKFQSEYFEDADELIRAKDDAWENVKTRREKMRTIRAFTNMMNTLTDEEAEQLGRTEITNHGLSHRDMMQQENQFSSMVTGTNALLEVIVDTDNPEKDLVMGMRISEAINKHALHYKGRFANFWRKVAGEIVIGGGVPVTQNEKYGWLPKLRTNMFFPKETPLDADDVTFAFDPVELSISDLEKLSNSVKGSQSKLINKSNIDKLIEKLKEQIENNTKDQGTTFGEEIQQSPHSDGRNERSTTVSGWWYYEVKRKDDGDSYVSSTLFVDGINGLELEGEDGKSASGAAVIVAYIDKAFESAEDWLHNVYVDSEIGGVKNMDTLRGVAEMTYSSALETEELLNLIMEGDKIRARPKIRLGEDADPDEVAKWDVVQDLYAPRGVEEMPFKNNGQHLLTPFSLLSQNVSGMAGGAVSNTGQQNGELRQQALERQRNTSMLQATRVSEAYNHMDAILENVVWRILASDTKPGTDGYRDIMCVRAQLEKYGIPYKELAERKYGRFTRIRVRARRSIGNGDRQQQIETSDWLMANLTSYAPGVRPMVLHKATVLRTQDPDEADALVKVPKAIINAQKITAENEYDTIRRRAALGQTLPIADDDVHQDHIPVHLLDMQAHIAADSIRPWDMMDVIAFAGIVEHVGEHLRVLMENPLTHGEGVSYVQDYQNVTQAAQRIIQRVEEQEQANSLEGDGLTPKERVDAELKAEKLRLEGIKIGIKAQEMEDLRNNRQQREDLAKRKQYVGEINDSRRLELDKQRVRDQRASQDKQTPTT